MSAPKKKRVKARAGKRKAPSRPPDPNTVRVPDAIDIALDEQRDSHGTAITIVYCLHSALRREIEDAGTIESDEVEEASEEADLTEITSMLLVRLNAIHRALDSTELEHADVDPDRLELAEAVRKMRIGDERRKVKK